MGLVGIGDVQDVVEVLRVEDAGGPVEAAMAERAEIAPETALPGLGHDLLEVRIADEEVLQEARLVRIGARKLGGRGGAVCLGVAAISREVGVEFVGEAGHRVEARINVIARQMSGGIGKLKILVIVAAANRRRERLGKVQRIGEEQPVIVGRGREVDRRDIERAAEEDAVAGDGKVLRVQRPKLSDACGLHIAVVDARASDENIVEAE